MAAVIWAAPNCLPSIGPEVQCVSVTAPTLRRALNSRPRDGGRDAKLMSTRPPDRPLSRSMASLLARRPGPHRSPHASHRNVPPAGATLHADGLITGIF